MQKVVLTEQDTVIASFLKTIAKRKMLQRWILCMAWSITVTAFMAFVLNITAIFVPIYNAPLYGLFIIIAGLIIPVIYIIVKRVLRKGLLQVLDARVQMRVSQVFLKKIQSMK